MPRKPRAPKPTTIEVTPPQLPPPPTPTHVEAVGEVEVEATDVVETPDDVVADIPPYKPNTQSEVPGDPMIEVVGAELPRKNKGGRPKGFSPKKAADVAPIDIAILLDVVDLLGVTFAGEAGALNVTERAIATQGLNSLSRTSREAITQVADKIGPLLLLGALALWALRILNVRAEMMRAKRATAAPLSQAVGETNGTQSTPAATPVATPPVAPSTGVDPAELYRPISSNGLEGKY